MPTCSASGVTSDAHASDKLWSNVPGARWAVFIVGFTFAGITLALYGLLIHRHAIRGRRLHPSPFLPEKLKYQERLLYLGPLMVIFFLVQMCAPELASMAELFQNTYKAMAYYSLMRFTGLQLGLTRNMFRDDGSGTLQQHKPCKIWNKPPCCCVWVFFLPFMKERIVSGWDVRLAHRLTIQYCYIGPLTAVLKMIVFYEGVKAANAASVSLVCDIVGLISIMSAAYAVKVFSTIAETVPSIQHQLKQRSWFNHGKELGDNTAAPNKNISVKNSWIMIATVTPVIAGVVVGLVVKDDLCLDNGEILLVQDIRNYIIAFIAILLNFLAGVFAFTKAFPVPGPQDHSWTFDFVATKYLELELWPAFALENFPSSITEIIEERKRKGKDPNLGKPAKLWEDTFGECTSPGAAASQSDGPSMVSQAPVRVEMV